MDRQSVFDAIARDNLWGDPETVSGPGSTLAATRHLRRELPALLSRLRVQRLLDVLCGDFTWMQAVDLEALDIHYVGADIVEAIVARNLERHAGPGRRFVRLDFVVDPLPACDLVLCRDALVHLPWRDIHAALGNFVATGARWLLATHFPWLARDFNQDIQPGQWRPLNLAAPPLSWPVSWTLVEGCELEGWQDKSLALIDLHAAARHE